MDESTNEKFWRSFNPEITRSVIATDLPVLLYQAFSWRLSPEGMDYWVAEARQAQLSPSARESLQNMLCTHDLRTRFSLPTDPELTETFCPPEHLTGNTVTFDDALKRVTQDRGSVYGHPLDDFAKVQKVKEAVAGCPDPEIRHALEMIGVKMARLAQTPDHLDSAIDIAGYARTICMIVDERRRRG